MKIFNLKGENIKFESKKENDVLVDVFLKKSVEDLKKLGIYYNFDGIRKDKDWRDYIECKLKVVMGIESGDCFNGELEIFYIKEILDKFFGKKGFNQFYEDNGIIEEILNNLFLKEYFKEIDKNSTIEYLNLKQNGLKLEGLDFLGIVNGFIFMAGDINTKGYYNLYVYRYRLPLRKVNSDIIHLINKNDIFYTKLDEYKKKTDIDFLKDISNFLLTKINLTQDIQEIKFSR